MIDFGGIFVSQLQHGEYQPCGLVQRVIRAVTIAEVCGGKALRKLLNQLLDSVITIQFPILLRVIQGVCIIAPMDSRKFFIAAVAIVAIVTGIWMSTRVLSPPPQPQTATILPAPSELAEFSLVSDNGDAFTREDFAGRWNLVFFGFTHCPDICPITLQVLANARKAMRDAGLDELPRVVLVSVDPERDTPAVLAAYVANFGDDTIGITGDLDEVRKLTDGLGIFFEKSGIDGDAYSVDHSSVVIVINPEGQFHALFGTPHKAENFARDLPIIMAQQ